MEVVSIPLSSIIVPEHYISVKHRPQTCEVIKATGYILPIVVRKDRDKYILIDGLERINCAKALGWEEIPAIVAEKDETLLGFVLNYIRGKYCGIDVLMYTYMLSQSYSVDLIARILHKEAGTIRKYLKSAEKLIVVLSKDDIERLKIDCIKLRKLIACVMNNDSRTGILQCLYGAPKKNPVKISPAVIKRAIELEKDEKVKEAMDVIDAVGPEGVLQSVNAVSLIRQTLCPHISQLIRCIPPDAFAVIREICR